MGKKNENKICIEELDLRSLMLLLRDVFIDRNNCINKSCSDCIADCNKYVEEHSSCKEVEKHILEKALTMIENGFDKSVCEKGNCRNCKHMKENTNYLFCDFWHNFTIQDGYCHGFADKQEAVDKS